MKQLLLDSCIYGEMVLDPELGVIQKAYHNTDIGFVYGFSLIRKELRNTPKNKRQSNKNLRIFLLSLYDEFVGERNLSVEESDLLTIAQKYYEQYRQLGGNFSLHELLQDYLIVACATKKKMDLVVSNDHVSMLSDISLKAYTLVNQNLSLKNPHFIDYKTFKALLFGRRGGD